MQENRYITREPLLNAKQEILGYRLNWHGDDSPEGSAALVDIAAECFQNAEDGWRLGSLMVFVPATPALLDGVELAALPPEYTVLRLNGADLADPAALDVASDLRSQGYGISIRNVQAVAGDKAILSLASHIEMPFAAGDLTSRAKQYGSVKQLATRVIAEGVTSWEDFDACAALGLDAFVGKLHLTPRPSAPQKGLNPAQAAIMKMMQMVQQNADTRELESVLKHDPTVSYKLLRFINSAGFGQRTEVQSLRHAVALLGYAPLFRWLSLLLATASSSGYSPVLMQTAIVRGRFAELVGTKLLPAGKGENLFVAGMFSLLDRLTGIPMNDLLDKIMLPEDVRQALVDRQGALGPYLALAEACELNSQLVSSLAASLRISAKDVNKAHLDSLAWATSLLFA